MLSRSLVAACNYGRIGVLRRRMIPFSMIFLVLAMTVLPGTAQAYVDPNASNLLFQIGAPIVATLVAGIVFLKQATIGRIKSVGSLIRRGFNAAVRKQGGDEGTRV